MAEYIERGRLLRDPYFQEDRYPESHLLRMAIINQPAADVVPVVHGVWEFSHTSSDGFAIVKCSNCGHDAFAIAFYVKEGNYCPNCGAKMGGNNNG